MTNNNKKQINTSFLNKEKCLVNFDYIMKLLPVFDPFNQIILCWNLIMLSIYLTYSFFIPIHMIYDISYSDLMPNFIVYITPFIIIFDVII